MLTMQIFSYTDNELGYEAKAEGKKSLEEFLQSISNYSLPKPIEEYGEWGAPPAFMAKVSENNYVTISKPEDGKYTFYMYYLAGNVDIKELDFEYLAELMEKYYQGNHFKLFKEIAKSGDAYVILGSTFKAKILNILLKI